MTSRPVSMRRRLGVAVAATALATVPLAGSALAQPIPYAVTPAGAAAAPAADAPSVARAAAAGKITPSTPGCTVTPAAAPDPEIVRCDLWAKAGTNQVLGQPIPIWGYSPTSDGAATAPGPVIVARQGDRVEVTLHNALGQPTSLAFPGQRAADFIKGLPTLAQDAGVADGDTGSYTFTASRAGTFLYEAGHTANAARQLAMGLSGALVVLGDGTAYGHAYDDEAVLVLSEIDPALNANPTGFDMRDYHPAYRLINGKPFPSSDPVPTDPGHTVLLHYVNVGSELHSMSTLGAGQTVLSHDGHALAFPEPSIVVPVDAGVTVDALVTVPTGPESKVAVFESAARLDNAGQTAGLDSPQVAFGGMMTFLDTNAPPSDFNRIGPVSTNIAVHDNPADGTVPVNITATVSDATTGGQSIKGAEIVVDDATAVGVGFGLAMTGAFGGPGSSTTVTGTIPASASAADCASTAPPVDLHCLTSGKHTVFVRGQDASDNWGVVGSVILNLAKAGPQTVGATVSPKPANGAGAVTVSATGDDTAAGGTITGAEFFIGTAGANGTGTAMMLNRAAMKVAETGTIPAATVKNQGEGTTQVWVHSRNSQNIWGPAVPVDLVVDLTAPGVNASTVGPNPTNGVVGSKSYPGSLVISADLEDRDTGGGLQSNIVAAEAFVDPATTTPAGGTGLTLIAVDGKLDSPSEQVYGLIPLTQVRAMAEGEHKVYVRGKDAAGNWGDLKTANNALVRLLVDKTAPILSAPSGTPNPTTGASTLTLSVTATEAPPTGYAGPRFQAAEYWTGTTDPGAGKGTRVQVTDASNVVSAAIPLDGIAGGSVQFNLRVQDAAGNWSNVASKVIQVVRANAIFSDTFDSGNLLAWTSVTNAARAVVNAAAGNPVRNGNFGLAVTLPGRTSNGSAYVTDDSPLNETTYHAQFSFNPNTLVTGTAWVTVFEGRTATGQAFAVQFQRNTTAATSARQLRVVMSRNVLGGVGTTTGASYTAANAVGAHTVRVDWTQGTGGSLRLIVDGTARSTLTGNNTGTAMQVQTARLGITAGVIATTTTTMAGTAWFDSFVSTRISIP